MRYSRVIGLMFFLPVIILLAKNAYSQYQYPVSARCWPAFSNYSNCQQIGAAAQGPVIEICKKANEIWFSSGCASEYEAKAQELNALNLQWCQQMGINPCTPYSGK
jgi:hypothetical protein